MFLLGFFTGAIGMYAALALIAWWVHRFDDLRAGH